MSPKDAMLIGNRYKIIDTIGAGGMGTVYRAHDLLMNTEVALKQVTTPKEQLVTSSVPDPTKQSHMALASEFRTLASLRHPHIISVLDYGFDTLQYPYFTMELLPSAYQIVEIAYGMSVDEKWRLIVQMLQALSYLHRRGILHRDLKPDNVMVIKAPDGDYQVKVLDFGLAVAHDYTDQSETVIGTLAYVAPEILQMRTARRESDLYAIGLMMYEILAEKYPFDFGSINDLMEAILYMKPRTNLPGIERPVRSILKKLLQKEPEKRYTSAEAVLSAITEAVQLDNVFDSVAVRESFLQSAQFVGREVEYGKLQDAVRDAKEANGSLWLVEGESGVGKSRLLDEVRTLALVEGVTVLSGQGVSNAGLPYEIWRDVLRRLVLSVDVTDEQAGILKAIVPDIDRLLNRSIMLASSLSESAQKERLMDVIAQVIALQKQPILLLMEDLHWATDSLDPIIQLSDKIQDMSLCVIGSYRSDEKTDIDETLSSAEKIILNRLTETEVLALSESMVGAAAHQPGVIDLVTRETEGNTFFIVEVMRALAEDAGTLEHIGRVTLPSSVVTGGMNAVIDRRLNRVPEPYQQLLAVAAVAGRRLDLQILSHVLETSDDSFALDTWLTACDEAAVLFVRDDQWQFTHDKLRETLLQNLRDEAAIHATVAEAIEVIHANEPERYPALAQHWLSAGNIDKAIEYGIPAAKVMKNVSQYRDAIDLLYGIYRQWDQKTISPEIKCDFFIQLGELHERTGDYQVAQGYFEQSLTIAEMLDDPALLTGVHYGLGVVGYSVGEFETSLQHLQVALDIGETNADPETIAKVYKIISNVYSKRDDFENSNDYINRALVIAREHDIKIEIAGGLNNLGVNFYLLGQHAEARDYYEQALKVYQDVGYRTGIALSLGNLGDVVYEDGLDAQLEYYNQALEIHRDIGNQWGMALCLENKAMSLFMSNRHQEAMVSFQEALQIARKISDKYGIQHMLMELGLIHSLEEEFEKATACFDESLALAHELELGLNLVSCHAYTALHYINMMELKVAQDHIKTAFDLIPTINSPYALLDALSAYARLLVAEERIEQGLLITILVKNDFNLDDGISKFIIEPLLAKLKLQVSDEDYARIDTNAQSLDVSSALDMLADYLAEQSESDS